jgi:hypothetical protein
MCQKQVFIARVLWVRFKEPCRALTEGGPPFARQRKINLPSPAQSRCCAEQLFNFALYFVARISVDPGNAYQIIVRNLQLYDNP